MRAGLFVGRVGGLAVALGVGVAVASSPGLAWADDTGSASSEGSSGTGATDTSGTSESQGTSTTIGTTAEPAEASTVAGLQTKDASTPTSGSVDASEPGISVSTDASVRQAPPGTTMSTGGAHSSTKSNSETLANGDVAAELTTDDSALSEPVADSTAKGGSNRRQRVNDSMGAQGAEANSPTATRTVVDVVEQRPTAAVNARTYLPPQANSVAQAISASRTEPTEPPSTVSAVVLAALATTGLGPLAPNGPLTPVDSPLELALLAVGARTRTFGEPAIEESRTLSVSSALTGQSVDGEQTFAAAAMVATVNSAPNVPAQPVGTPDPVTGVVTGTVIGTDPDNNALTYAVTGAPTKGAVQLNSQTGAYTYTPTQAARLAAGATLTADTDSFTVAVSDGQETTTAPVSVYISPIRFENEAPIALGTNPSGVVVGPDGRMYVTNTGSGTVSVINTVTGQRIDANSSSFSKDIKVGSSPSALALSADGKRLYVANTGSGTVSVIDTTTYKRIDVNPSFFSKDIKVGSSPSALALNGTRLYVANRGSNTVSVIDTTTNKLVDVNPNVSGTQSISVGSTPSALAQSGTSLYVANRGSNTVSVINTISYSVATTITVGSQPSSVALGADSRLYVTNTGSGTVSVINTVTNAVATNAVSVGPSPSSVAFSPNGSLAYVANANDTVSVIDTATYKVITTVAIDTDTSGGHVIAVAPGGTIYVTDAADKTVRVLTITESAGLFAIGSVTITGDRPGSLLLSADGTRAVLVTAYPRGIVTANSYPDGVDGSTTRVVVIDTATGRQLGTTFTVTGLHAADVRLSADGTRALITASAYDATGTRVVVVNLTTGTQVGTTFALAGGGSAQLIANDSRALIITTAYSTSTNTTTDRVAVLNTTTGAQVGTTSTLNGLNLYGSSSGLSISPDGTRLLITTGANVSVINTITGAQTGTSLSGSWFVQRWSPDASRAVIISTVLDAAGTTTRLAELDITTGNQIGTTLAIAGNGSLQYSADGTRALVTSKVTNTAGITITRLAVFNTTTGTQTGTTLTLTGDGSVQTNADGSRALITRDIYDSATASHSTQLTVFNTATGTQTGTTLTLTGGLLYGVHPKFSPDGTRALVTTDVYDSTTTLRISRVTTIDTSTGTKIGTTLTLTGPEPVETTWRADGTRALITMTPTQYDSVTSPMLVAVIDTTGNQIGTTLSLPGMPTYGDRPVWSTDGTRALITTRIYDSTTGLNTTRVTTINTTTGTQIGATVTLTSGAFGGRAMLIPNGNRAMITAGDQVAVINTNTGTQTGTTVTIDGTPSALSFSADGSRAVITTADHVTVIDTTTGTQVGTTFALSSAGSRSIVAVLTADGTHALITTDRRNIGYPGIATTPIAVINLTTGTQIGTTLNLIGDTYASPAFTLDGAHALITTGVDDSTTGVSTTRVTTINIATGVQIGATVTLTGVLSSGVGNPMGVLLSPDGTRALVATTSGAGGTRTSQVAMINTATGTKIGNTVTINGALSGLRWSTDGTRVFVTTYITTATGADLSIRETVLETF